MCGIVGKASSQNCEKSQIIEPLKALIHRGPDKQNYYCDKNVLLGHARLSIIDIKYGNQPMSFYINSKKYIIIYNGEVYNFKLLREKLISVGFNFETESDTEVILKWLAHKGIEEGVLDLNGMFSIAIYNETDKKLYLLRDRVGIKPLFYTVQNEGFLFSSELDSIIKFDKVKKSLNAASMEQFLYFGFPLAPNTMYENIYEVRPGYLLEYNLLSKEIRHKQYWNIDDYERTYNGTFEDGVEELNELLNMSISDQIISDVGYGTFLSGGIDSSLITSIVNGIKNDKFNAYTVSFNDEKYDELPYAKKVVQSLDNVNHVIYHSSNFSLDTGFVDMILKHVGQPFADSSCIPTYLIANEVHKNEKVILSGDGGDELFMGYETFTWLSKIERVKVAPVFVRHLVLFLFQKLPMEIVLNKDFHRQINKAVSYSFMGKGDLESSLNSILDLVDLEKLLISKSFEWLKELKSEILKGTKNPFDIMQKFLLKIKLSGDMLKKIDSMSMANSIEVRVPLLDNRIIDFALSLPVEYCYKGGVKKRILREVAKKHIPKSVICHKKWGFSIPMHKVLNKEFIGKYEYLRKNQSILNIDFMNKFSDFEAISNKEMYRNYSQYTIDHVNWMTILLYRWMEKNEVNYDK